MSSVVMVLWKLLRNGTICDTVQLEVDHNRVSNLFVTYEPPSNVPVVDTITVTFGDFSRQSEYQ